MNSPIHPPDEVLVQYGLGKLGNQSAETIDEHVTTCAECRERVAELSSDSFVNRLQQAAPHDTPQPISRIYQSGPSDPTSATSTNDIPPELAEMRHYENIRELGRGGMGIVYLATTESCNERKS